MYIINPPPLPPPLRFALVRCRKRKAVMIVIMVNIVNF